MITLYKTIGTHNIEFSVFQKEVVDFLNNNFYNVCCNFSEIDLRIEVVFGFASSFNDYNVTITKEKGKIFFRRSDYLIEANMDYGSALIFINDELALKHALMNLYSAYIVYHNWGLLIHSSCIIENGRAHIFAGQSGAGKSTAARLSHPRDLLSDEATLVKITQDEIIIFNSPFRSEISDKGLTYSSPLSSIQILHKSIQNKRINLKKVDALVSLIDKIFYWSHDSEETKNVLKLLRLLVDRIPIYDLYFKKDETFWELIS